MGAIVVYIVSKLWDAYQEEKIIRSDDDYGIDY